MSTDEHIVRPFDLYVQSTPAKRFGNGERGETPRFALTASQLASIDAICVFMDWQTRDRTGIRVDDVVLRVQPSFPSDD